MKRPILDSVPTLSRLRSLHLLFALIFVYFFIITTQFPLIFRFLDTNQKHQIRFLNQIPLTNPTPKFLSKLNFHFNPTISNVNNDTTIYQTAIKAWLLGAKLWAQLGAQQQAQTPSSNNQTRGMMVCPESVSGSGLEMGLPCGLTIGSHITMVGKLKKAHKERQRRISGVKDVMVTQFMVELRENTGRVEEPPGRLLHFNPRIKGDWSKKPVIEMNNCYRGQWGTAVRCEGWKSPSMEDTVDGQAKCEKWIINDNNYLEESQASLWLNKLIGRKKKTEFDWPYPFSEGRFFVLTIMAGFEGYHISVDGRHITSFTYRNGFDLENAMMLYSYGDVDVHYVFAASLPTFHPSVAPERHLDMSPMWKAQPLPDNPIVLFIGVISAGDHFAERMAVRKSWMQHNLVKSSTVVPRFFVALHKKESINLELRKEAEYFGDIIIVPYLDNYELVVLKTLAICEYGVNMLTTKYVMKCDDDTFVRVDAVIEEAERADSKKSLYAGKMNYYHTPLRTGKWAVTYEEWPDEVYAPYADGPGYIVSSDIVRFIMSEFQKNRLRLFKMEDVSMGMWVEQFNKLKPVEYLHNPRFHQAGCVDDYYTAHYQSPKQLICLWEKLQSEGKPICCNLR